MADINPLNDEDAIRSEADTNKPERPTAPQQHP